LAEKSWNDTQMGRLKAKFIDREGKPATRFALVRHVVRGSRGTRGSSGTPSQYVPSGIKNLLAKPETPERQQDQPHEAA
jgi:hypothetical protein